MGKVGHLSELNEKYYDRGLRIVAVSSEPEELLRKEMLDKRQATYWIGSDPEDAMLKGFVDGEQLAIPRFYVVDAHGNVVGSGFPSEAEIERLLRESFELDLGKKLHARLDPAVERYRQFAYGAALDAANALVDDDDPAVAGDARLVRDKVTAYAEFLRREVPFQLEGMHDDEAYGRLLILEHRFAGLPLAQWAHDEGQKRADTDEVKKLKDAFRKLDEALARDVGADGKVYERRRAREMYEKVAKRYPLTAAARLADELTEHLADTR